jgi:protein phosphatase
VGDSRVYRVRDGEIAQLSEEHTQVEEFVKAGLLSQEQAAKHPNAHVLTRAIGAEEHVEPQIEAFDLKPGDIFVLCSDGLTNHVSDERILEAASRFGPSETVWRLVNAAIAAGGRDNCTVVCVRVDELAPYSG